MRTSSSSPLSPVEQAYLNGTREFTNAQKRYIRCRLRKKLKLLDERSCNVAAALQQSCNGPYNLLDSSSGSNISSALVAQPGRALPLTNNDNNENGSLGRDSSPRPLPQWDKAIARPIPYQGNALPG